MLSVSLYMRGIFHQKWLPVLMIMIGGNTLVFAADPSACRLSVQSLAFGSGPELLWKGVPQVGMSGPSNLSFRTTNLPPDFANPNRRDFHLLRVLPSVAGIAFTSVDFNARRNGKPGFSSRAVTYSSFDPRAVRENIYVHDQPNQTIEQEIDLPFEAPQDLKDAAVEMGEAFAFLTTDRVNPKLSIRSAAFFPYSTQEEAVKHATSLLLSRIAEDAKKVGLNDLKALIPNDEMAKLYENNVESRWNRFRKTYISDEMRSGRFGDFQESLFITNGKIEDASKGALGNHRIYTYVISMGRMHYTYSFVIPVK